MLQIQNLKTHARASLPTQYGNFKILAFSSDNQLLDHVALYRGNLQNAQNLPTRIHSECLTGDVFHSLRCDCRQQLESALRDFAGRPDALLLYMRQEGRGIGIANKIAAYRLQEQGMDTVDANIHLGFDDDLRSYDIAAAIISHLDIISLDLYTNNPNKISGLTRLGIKVTHRHPIIIEPNDHNMRYLNTKRDRCGHMLNF